MQFKFCPEFGEKLITKTIGDEGETSFCENCGRPWFIFSYPCVICLLTDGAGKYALIRQTYATRNYVCVAGFIKEHETAEQTALREIREETGLEVLNMRYISSYYYSKHDNLMLGYLCTVNTESSGFPARWKRRGGSGWRKPGSFSAMERSART